MISAPISNDDYDDDDDVHTGTTTVTECPSVKYYFANVSLFARVIRTFTYTLASYYFLPHWITPDYSTRIKLGNLSKFLRARNFPRILLESNKLKSEKNPRVYTENNFCWKIGYFMWSARKICDLSFLNCCLFRQQNISLVKWKLQANFSCWPYDSKIFFRAR